jgi:protein SCO1/2
MAPARRIAAAVTGGLALLALLAAVWVLALAPRFDRTVADSLGHGDYALVTTDGGSFTQDTLKGEPSAVFFGFAHCPEVCPTTLGDIAGWQDMLAQEGQGPLRTFFVTVDPERDTPEMLRDYVSWAPGVTGVSGPPDEIAKALRAFRIYAQKVPLDGGGYTMDHSALVLLFDARGRFFEPIGYQEETARAMDKIHRLLEG